VVLVGSAEPNASSAPEVLLVGDHTRADSRTLRVRVTPGRAPGQVWLHVASPAGIVGVVVDDVRLRLTDSPAPPTGPPSSVRVRYLGPPDGFDLSVEVHRGAGVSVQAMTLTYGLPASAGHVMTRPAHLIARPALLSEISMVRRRFQF
jgi:hypothetical protein